MVRMLYDRLNDVDYDVRERAARQLVDLGIELKPEQREALRRPDPLSIPSFRGFGLAEPPPRLLPPPVLLPLMERVRSSRAVAALERSHAAAAESLLDTLADGNPTAPLTREAKAALARVRRRH